jgi:hypothetical protein
MIEARPFDGKPITEPGVYADVPMEIYHGQLTDTPSISSSGLRTIESQTPAHYYAGSYLNPNAEQEESKALNIGRAAHSLLLGDEPFHKHFVVSPFPDFRKKEAREWRDEKMEQGFTILTAAQYQQILAMKKVLEQEPLVKAGLLKGAVEYTFVWKDEKTGIWLKSRIDLIPHQAYLIDYKSTVSAAPFKIQKSNIDYRYFSQLALGTEGLIQLGLMPKQPLTWLLLFQEKSPPYSVVPQEIEEDFIWRGAQLNRRALDTFAECLEKDEWPSWDLPPVLRVPDWMHEKLQREEDSNLLPEPPEWLNALKEVQA